METEHDAHGNPEPGDGNYLVQQIPKRRKQRGRQKPRKLPQPLLPYEAPLTTSPAVTQPPFTAMPDPVAPAQERQTGNASYLFDNKSRSSNSDTVQFPGRMAPEKTKPPHLRKLKIDHPGGYRPIADATRLKTPVVEDLPFNTTVQPKGSWAKPKPALKDDAPWEPQIQPSTTWSSDVDSAVADAGFGEGVKKKRKGAKDASNYQLTDWSGNWAPAPVDWESRPGFTDDAQIAQIKMWIDDSNAIIEGLTSNVIRIEMSAAEHEIAPSYWTPEFDGKQHHIGSETIAEWLQSSPDPVDCQDMEWWTPFWERYTNEHHLAAHHHPSVEGIDPDETEAERISRENDYGIAHYKENKSRTAKAKQAARAKKQKERRERSKPGADTVIRPKLDLYISAANDADALEIRDIYNFYVRNSPTALEVNEVTDEDVSARIRSAKDNKLPFLVACKKGEIIKGRRARQTEDVQLPDTVIGMAWLENYHDAASTCRSTTQLYFYTHYQYYGKCVAQCLVDKMLGLVDTSYQCRTELRNEGNEVHDHDQHRAVQTVVIFVPYSKPADLAWLERWLTRSEWGFKRVGHLDDVGEKGGQSVHEAIFLKRIGGTVDNGKPPE